MRTTVKPHLSRNFVAADRPRKGGETGPFPCPVHTKSHCRSTMSLPPPESARHYPPALEQWWVDRVNHSDVHTLENLHRNASVLSDHFTTKRDKGFPDYFKKPGHLLAYGLYFHPQSWVRTRFPLMEAIQHRGWQPDGDGPIQILDVGSGPGSACLSALQLLQTAFPDLNSRATAVDQSPMHLTPYAAAMRTYWTSGPDQPCGRRRGTYATDPRSSTAAGNGSTSCC